MRLCAGCEIVLETDQEVPLVLVLRPSSGAAQWVEEERHQLTPRVPVWEYIDSFGNICQRLLTPVGRFVIRTQVTVETAPTIDVAPGAPLTPIPALPDSALQFLLPSRYCPSDTMGALALEVTGGSAPGYDQVERIRAWIHENITYRYGSSTASTTAQETADQRVGVCRDFAHLGMALCRSLSIPARMVVGYLKDLDPMDLHAWFEAFVGGRWYTFDATQDQPCGGRIAIAYGRDAADVALMTQFGPGTLSQMRVWVNDVSDS